MISPQGFMPEIPVFFGVGDAMIGGRVDTEKLTKQLKQHEGIRLKS